MLAILEFNYRGETITKYISNETLFNDIQNISNFEIEFMLGKIEYVAKILWDSSEICIYVKGETKPIYYVNGFSLYFSRNLK